MASCQKVKYHRRGPVFEGDAVYCWNCIYRYPFCSPLRIRKLALYGSRTDGVMMCAGEDEGYKI